MTMSNWITEGGKESDGSKLGLFSLTGAVIVLCSVGCEVGKQVSNYSINYYNGGEYPLPQTVLVRQTCCYFHHSLLPPGHPDGANQANGDLLEVRL